MLIKQVRPSICKLLGHFLKVLNDRNYPVGFLKGLIMEKNCLGTALWICIATVILVYMTGCGQILGIREVDAWGLKMQFAEGIDFGVGMNSVDNVHNERGVSRLPKQQGAILK